jgi:hypothetical protein
MFIRLIFLKNMSESTGELFFNHRPTSLASMRMSAANKWKSELLLCGTRMHLQYDIPYSEKCIYFFRLIKSVLWVCYSDRVQNVESKSSVRK